MTAISPMPGSNIAMQTWTVAADGRHNAFTDLIYWRGEFWLIFTSSRSHFASSESKLVLWHAADAAHWEEASRFSTGEDLRDPKLAVIGNRLVVYALLNKSFDPQPYQTVCFVSSDGKTWSEAMDVAPRGWLLGKPITQNGFIWFAPAHHLGQRTAQVVWSTDGMHWQMQLTIQPPEHADETAIAFTPGGDLAAVTRLEIGSGVWGSAGCGTLISFARPPYSSWHTQVKSSVTRLDGPALFVCGRLFAVGRRQPQTDRPFNRQGSIFARKRTAIFEVAPERLRYLADLPGGGDTGYAGIAANNGNIYISYYTNALESDPAWIVGMLQPTQVRIACISPVALSEAVDRKVEE